MLVVMTSLAWRRISPSSALVLFILYLTSHVSARELCFTEETYFTCPKPEDAVDRNLCCGSNSSQHCCDEEEYNSSNASITDDGRVLTEAVEIFSYKRKENDESSKLAKLVVLNLVKNDANITDYNDYDYDDDYYYDANETIMTTTSTIKKNKTAIKKVIKLNMKGKKKKKPNKVVKKITKAVTKAAVKTVSALVWFIIAGIVIVCALTYIGWQQHKRRRQRTHRTEEAPRSEPGPPADPSAYPLIPTNQFQPNSTAGPPPYPSAAVYSYEKVGPSRYPVQQTVNPENVQLLNQPNAASAPPLPPPPSGEESSYEFHP